MNTNKELNEFFLTEDEKYGGLEADNLKEALDYYQIENIIEHRSKDNEDANHKIESDNYNSVRINGKNTTRTLRMSNRDWHKLNQITK